MTSDDAARLVNLIVATWPTGPKAYVWTQTLAELDNGPANQAYRDLRDTAERITIAAYQDRYRRHANTSRSQRRAPSEHCPHCRGCGYEDGPPEYETVNGEPHEYTTVVPCRCTQPRTTRRAAATPSLLEEF